LTSSSQKEFQIAHKESDSFNLKYGLVAGSCELGSAHPGFNKDEEIFD
jgi:hypothetical protein